MLKKENLKLGVVMTSLLLLLIGMSVLSLGSGKVNLFMVDKALSFTIILKIRAPRILLAIVVGMALSVTGTVFQCLLNNPLADSYTLGISSGAAFGACLALYLNIVYNTNIPIQSTSVTFAIIVLFLVMIMARTKGTLNSTNLILSGIIIGSVCSAAVSFLKAVANENAVSMIQWLMGNLSCKEMDKVLFLTAVVLIGIIACYQYSKELNIMTMGRREALVLGVDYDKINKILLVVCAVMTAFCVSICGIIGFVGLVVPHLSRMLVGADNRKIIPISAILGAIILLGADTITRVVLAHEIPVGVLTTLIGGPFFCYIFMKKK